MAVELDKGRLFEARTARLMTAEGAFVRRRVDLEAQYSEKFTTITDVDVLAFWFSRNLSETVTAVECKSTEGKSQPGTGDRLLWLAGLKELVSADHAILATHRNATAATRDIGKRVGCDVMDTRDIARRESVLGLTAEFGFGSHDPRLLPLEQSVFEATKRDEDLRRAYWFSRSEIWLSTPAAALKRALGALRLLGARWSDRLPDQERLAVEWLVAQITLGAVLAFVRMAGIAYRIPEDDFDQFLAERLAEGVAEYQALREISDQVDRYVVGVLASAGVGPTVSAAAMGAFLPKPPPYLEPAREVIARLADMPLATARLPRACDDLFARRFLPALATDPTWRDPPAEVGRSLRLVAAFLERQARLPAPLLAAISNGRSGEVSPAPVTSITPSTTERLFPDE